MEPEKKSNGALLGLIIIVIILTIGGVYIWQKNKDKIMNEPLPPSVATVTNQDATSLDDLEKDLSIVETDIGVDVDTLK